MYNTKHENFFKKDVKMKAEIIKGIINFDLKDVDLFINNFLNDKLKSQVKYNRCDYAIDFKNCIDIEFDYENYLTEAFWNQVELEFFERLNTYEENLQLGEHERLEMQLELNLKVF